MTLTPTALDTAVRAGDLDAVRALLRGADEKTRRACATVVQKARRHVSSDSGWSRGGVEAASVAAAGTFSGAAKVADLLLKGSWQWTDVWDDAVAVLLERDPPWLPDVVERLAAFDPGPEAYPPWWPLLEGLRTGAGLPRPRTGPYLAGLANQSCDTRPGALWEDLPRAVREDAELLDLLPALLCTADIGCDLTWRRSRHAERTPFTAWEPLEPAQQWTGALRDLSDDGLLDRDLLLDVVLEVLALGGRREHLAWFLELHEALAVTSEEIASRTGSYVAVCATGSTTAAKAAQALLRGVVDPDAEVVVGTSAAVLSRREKGLALTQLAWLQQAAPQSPDAVLPAFADGLTHERPDVQERTLQALAAVLPHSGAEVPEMLLAAAQALPPTLQPQADAVFGTAVNTRPLPPPAVDVETTRVPGPVQDLAALAAAVAQHLETGDLHAGERVLDGVASLAARDRAAFASSMAPFLARLSEEQNGLYAVNVLPTRTLLRLLLVGAPAPDRRKGYLRRSPAVVTAVSAPGSLGVLEERCAEVAASVRAGVAGPLLSLPAEACGFVDPKRVVVALEGGLRPGVVDLQQAALRMPVVDESLLRRLRACSSEAATWLASAWQAGPPPPLLLPAQVPAWRVRYDTVRYTERLAEAGAVASVGSRGNVAAQRAGAVLVDLGAPDSRAVGPVLHRLLSVEPTLPQRATWEYWEVEREDALQVLVSLPGQREVAAAHLITRALWVDHRLSARDQQCLVLLSEAAGALGRATALALGYALANGDVASRTAAVDALAGLAARGSADPAALGSALAELLSTEPIKPGRVAAALGEALRAPGCAEVVWATLAVALPTLITARRRGLHDLLAVAAEAALAARARGSVDGLAELSGEKGTSRVVVESRRLLAVLTGRES